VEFYPILNIHQLNEHNTATCEVVCQNVTTKGIFVVFFKSTTLGLPTL